MEMCLPKMNSFFNIKFRLEYSLNLKNNKMQFKQAENKIKILGT